MTSRLGLLLLGALFVGGGSTASAQKRPAPKGAAPACPSVNVSCPATTSGGPTFSGNVSGGDANVTPTFNWTVSNGSISAGQGTSSITLDLTGATGSVTATLDVGGYDRSCPTSSSCTTSIEAAPQARKVDEYTKLAAKDAEARLDNFAIQLMNDPSTTGHILAYRSHTSGAKDAQKAATKARDHLVKKRSIDGSRVMAIDAGTRDQATIELWITEPGAMPPTPTPTTKAKAKAKK